jgi:hypothetical protein
MKQMFLLIKRRFGVDKSGGKLRDKQAFIFNVSAGNKRSKRLYLPKL